MDARLLIPVGKTGGVCRVVLKESVAGGEEVIVSYLIRARIVLDTKCRAQDKFQSTIRPREISILYG